LVEFYHDTDIAAYEKSYSAMLFKVAPAQDRFDVLVTEWKDKDGAPSMLLLKYMESASQGMVIWNYSITAMSANGRAYDQAKADLLYGLANIQNNPEQIQAYNQEEAHKANVSWSAHNQRMRANEESFQRTQEAYRNSTDAVNRSMMSTWETQNASSDRMQNATVNGIHEEHTITDPSTGQQYQVEAGYERYWTNGQGEQIMSNDHFYEPGTDPSLNGQWTEVEIDD
jgi:hypothetical protein